jgi:hypothetical protein
MIDGLCRLGRIEPLPQPFEHASGSRNHGKLRGEPLAKMIGELLGAPVARRRLTRSFRSPFNLPTVLL